MDQDKLEMARGILYIIKKQFPDAFIAGGFLRDLDNMHEPKDLDIFTFQPPMDYDIPTPLLEADETYHGDSRIIGVTRYDVFKIQVDVVHLLPLDGPDSQLEAVEHFALGIQQIMLKETIGGGVFGANSFEIVRTDQYIQDQTNRTLTVYRCSTAPEASGIGAKVKSLSPKYPWTLVIPSEFTHYTEYLTGAKKYEYQEPQEG